jgi:environmental stress-induced protein Ves
MNYKIIPAKDCNPIRWAGGVSTELFIFPQDSKYQRRDFTFRLSTATVEVATSEFATLAGVSRTLLVLEGEVILSHEDHHVARLKKFDVDLFEGDWKTTSTGTCTDFNLMVRGGASGVVRAITLESEQNDHLEISDSTNWCFLYVYSGSAVFTINDTPNTLGLGDVLVLERFQSNVLAIKGLVKSELVFVQINAV